MWCKGRITNAMNSRPNQGNFIRAAALEANQLSICDELLSMVRQPITGRTLLPNGTTISSTAMPQRTAGTPRRYSTPKRVNGRGVHSCKSLVRVTRRRCCPTAECSLPVALGWWPRGTKYPQSLQKSSSSIEELYGVAGPSFHRAGSYEFPFPASCISVRSFGWRIR